MILLFGAGGQLGQELMRSAGEAAIPLTGLTHRQADITDRAAVTAVIERLEPSLVVNAAAYTKVDQAEREPDEAYRVNATGPMVLARACSDAGCPLVHISTDYVFDGAKEGAYREDDQVAPLGVYGKSKLEGELAVRAGAARHVILRTAWVYGEFGHNFLKTMLRLAKERDELRVVADQRGSPTSTLDLAQAILRIHAMRASTDWGTYHFAGGGETTWHGFAARIIDAQARFTGKRPEVKAIAAADFPTLAKRPRNSVLDSSRFAAAFGFRAAAWEQATDRTVAALLGSTS